MVSQHSPFCDLTSKALLRFQIICLTMCLQLVGGKCYQQLLSARWLVASCSKSNIQPTHAHLTCHSPLLDGAEVCVAFMPFACWLQFDCYNIERCECVGAYVSHTHTPAALHVGSDLHQCDSCCCLMCSRNTHTHCAYTCTDSRLLRTL